MAPKQAKPKFAAKLAQLSAPKKVVPPFAAKLKEKASLVRARFVKKELIKIKEI